MAGTVLTCASWRSAIEFSFQAEDGIRHLTVTGVQTCALPICRSPEIALRLPSLDELRAATRAAARDAGAEADSIAAAQRELGRRTSDLAQQRSRDATGARRGAEGEREGALPFQATERAQAVARDQEALQARVEELSRAVRSEEHTSELQSQSNLVCRLLL